jgi:putative glutamine amidotransferase
VGNGLRPLIAVTTSEMRAADKVPRIPEGEPPQVEMALGLPYLQALEAAGGLPVVVPPMALDTLDPLLDQVAGVCLSGGPDLDPEAYGAPRHPALGPIDARLDRFEIELARKADERGLPILAVCRGSQALNVARGGTLHQHLPDRAGVKVNHRQTEPGTEVTHEVEIAEGSKLAELMGVTHAHVNSFHHQAVDRVGRGLRAVAWCDDGVIEGLEAPARDFVVGVQWHAETLVHRPEHAALFSGLVDAASQAGARRRIRRVA